MKFMQSEQNVRNGYLAAFLLLLLIYASVFFSTIKMNRDFQRIEEAYNTIWNLEQVAYGIKDAESITRGYGFLYEKEYLYAFEANRKAVDSLLLKLEVLTENSQSFNTRKLKNLIKEEYLFLQKLIHNQSHGVVNYQQLGHIGAPEYNQSKTIFLLIEKMEKTERDFFNKNTYNLYRMPLSFVITNIVGLFISFILGFYAYRTYNKENREKRKSREELENGIKQLRETNTKLDELRSIEKFAVSGRITRTIAHEVRNPLTNINLACEQLKITDPDDAVLLEIIKRNAQRINHLTSAVLNSTKFTELRLARVFIHTVIEEALALAMDRINLSEIRIVKNIAPPREIEIDPEKIRIALLNIIINAIEAMKPQKGLLQIATNNYPDYCTIVIKDNGTGMNNEAVSRIFEPFFTTKDTGNGLGLTNTQNIIFNHKGKISVESTPGKGTTFFIKLNYVIVGHTHEYNLLDL